MKATMRDETRETTSKNETRRCRQDECSAKDYITENNDRDDADGDGKARWGKCDEFSRAQAPQPVPSAA